MTITVISFVVGLMMLVIGAEILIRGAKRLATACGISPLVVGLTVVAFGTSAPELAVVLKSAFANQPEIGLGNIVGSNIANVLLILGLSALITPLTVARQLVRFDIWIMIIASLALFPLGMDGSIGRVDGTILFLGVIIYISFSVWQSRRESAAQRNSSGDEPPTLVWRDAVRDLIMVVVGLAGLVIGAHWLVDAATTFARAWGVSELIIGLTIVAIGTSLPEVAASVVAGLKNERDIAVGNIVGSCILNILAVLGLGAAVSPAGIEVPKQALRFDLPVMTAVAVACLPVFFTGHRINRWEGALFLAYYVAYLTYLVLEATGSRSLATFEGAMLWFVIPLTVITLMVVFVRSARRS